MVDNHILAVGVFTHGFLLLVGIDRAQIFGQHLTIFILQLGQVLQYMVLSVGLAHLLLYPLLELGRVVCIAVRSMALLGLSLVIIWLKWRFGGIVLLVVHIGLYLLEKLGFLLCRCLATDLIIENLGVLHDFTTTCAQGIQLGSFLLKHAS